MLYKDVEKQKIIEDLSVELKSFKEINPPEWAVFVKTGNHKEFPPTQEDWWYIRAAAVLRKISNKGPIGVSKLRHLYGGKKNRGFKPEKFVKGSGNIIRKILQQLDAAGLTKQGKQDVHKGRLITEKGEALLNSVAKNIISKLPKKQKEETIVKELKTPKKEIVTDSKQSKKDDSKIEKKDADKQNIDKQNIDKQNIDKQNIDKQSIDNQSINKQENDKTTDETIDKTTDKTNIEKIDNKKA